MWTLLYFPHRLWYWSYPLPLPGDQHQQQLSTNLLHVSVLLQELLVLDLGLFSLKKKRKRDRERERRNMILQLYDSGSAKCEFLPTLFINMTCVMDSYRYSRKFPLLWNTNITTTKYHVWTHPLSNFNICCTTHTQQIFNRSTYPPRKLNARMEKKEWFAVRCLQWNKIKDVVLF